MDFFLIVVLKLVFDRQAVWFLEESEARYSRVSTTLLLG